MGGAAPLVGILWESNMDLTDGHVTFVTACAVSLLVTAASPKVLAFLM